MMSTGEVTPYESAVVAEVCQGCCTSRGTRMTTLVAGALLAGADWLGDA